MWNRSSKPSIGEKVNQPMTACEVKKQRDQSKEPSVFKAIMYQQWRAGWDHDCGTFLTESKIFVLEVDRSNMKGSAELRQPTEAARERSSAREPYSTKSADYVP